MNGGTTSGTYTLTLKNVSPSGVVLESIPEFDGLDYPEHEETKGHVRVDGNEATGDISTSGDKDWFSVRFKGGKIYQIDAKGASSSSGTLSDPFIIPRDHLGNLLWPSLRDEVLQIDGRDTGLSHMANDNAGTGNDARLIAAVNDGGKYHVSIEGQGGTGTYTISVTETTFSEPAGQDFSSDATTEGRVIARFRGGSTGNIDSSTDRRRIQR